MRFALLSDSIPDLCCNKKNSAPSQFVKGAVFVYFCDILPKTENGMTDLRFCAILGKQADDYKTEIYQRFFCELRCITLRSGYWEQPSLFRFCPKLFQFTNWWDQKTEKWTQIFCLSAPPQKLANFPGVNFVFLHTGPWPWLNFPDPTCQFACHSGSFGLQKVLFLRVDLKNF